MSISALFEMFENNINIIIILVFASVPLLIGSAAATRSVSTVSDFFLCNRSLGTAISFSTIYATWWSSFAFLGSTSSFYFQGPVYWIALGWNALFGIAFMIFGRKLRQEKNSMNYRTPVDFFNDKYNSPILNKTIIVMLIVFTIPYISVQFMGGGILIEMATNSLIPWRISTLFFLFIMIIYIWSGGLRAVAWTDSLYTILIFTGMLLTGIIFIHMTGGISETFKAISETSPQNLHFPEEINGVNGYGFWISLLIVMPMGELMMPQIWTRIYAIKEKKTFYIMPILLCISTIAYAGPMLAGNAALVLEPDYNGSVDYILPTMLINYLPPVLMSIIICCAVSACLSTANSQLHSLSQIIILDVYKNCFNTKATEKHLVFMAKLVILLIAVFTYMLLLSGSLTTIFDTTLMSFCVIMQLIVPAAGALWWDKADADTALAGLLLGLSVTLLLSFWHPFTMPLSSGLIGLICNAALFVISCHFKAKCSSPAIGGSYDK